jgi:voltage-gated potassium channel Kch
MAERLLYEMLVIVAASFAAVALLARRRLSPIVGYLAVGVLMGPHGLNLLPATEGVRLLGELGVAFLMFIVGLEFSLPRMIAARGVVFGMGGLQVAATTVLAAVLTWAFGLGWMAGLVLGGAVAMSSTAISAKQLADQGELNTQHGRLAIGMLLFQDLASVPFLVLIDALRSGESAAVAGLRAGVAVALFLIFLLLARRPLAWFMAWVARARSAELFLLAALMLVLGATAIAHGVGLSLPIGAFLAGMVVGEGAFRHQLEMERLRLAQDQDHRVMFGDATRRGVLEAAGLKRAGAIVSTLPVGAGVERLVRHVRQHAAPDLPVIASTDDEVGLRPLVEAGATRVLPENLAAGLGLVAHTLAALGIDPGEVEVRMEAIRVELNSDLRGLSPTVDAEWHARDASREP